MTDAQQSSENLYHVFPYGAEIPYVPRPAYETETRVSERVGHQEDSGLREDREHREDRELREDREHQYCMRPFQEYNNVPLLMPATDAEQSNESRHQAKSPHVPAPAYETETRASTRVERREDSEHQSCMQSSQGFSEAPSLKPAADAEQGIDNRCHVFPYGAESPYVPRPAYETETREFARVECREDIEQLSRMQSSQECSEVPSLKPAADAEQDNDNRYHVFPYGAESPYVPQPAYETETREFARVGHREDRQHRSRMQPSQEHIDAPSLNPATNAEQDNDNQYHIFPYGAEGPYVPRPVFETETRVSAQAERRAYPEHREDREQQSRMQSTATDAEESNGNRYHVFPYGAESPYVPFPTVQTPTPSKHRSDHEQQHKQVYAEYAALEETAAGMSAPEHRYEHYEGASVEYRVKPALASERQTETRHEHQEQATATYPSPLGTHVQETTPDPQFSSGVQYHADQSILYDDRSETPKQRSFKNESVSQQYERRSPTPIQSLYESVGRDGQQSTGVQLSYSEHSDRIEESLNSEWDATAIPPTFSQPASETPGIANRRESTISETSTTWTESTYNPSVFSRYTQGAASTAATALSAYAGSVADQPEESEVASQHGPVRRRKELEIEQQASEDASENVSEDDDSPESRRELPLSDDSDDSVPSEDESPALGLRGGDGAREERRMLRQERKEKEREKRRQARREEKRRLKKEAERAQPQAQPQLAKKDAAAAPPLKEDKSAGGGLLSRIFGSKPKPTPQKPGPTPLAVPPAPTRKTALKPSDEKSSHRRTSSDRAPHEQKAVKKSTSDMGLGDKDKAKRSKPKREESWEEIPNVRKPKVERRKSFNASESPSGARTPSSFPDTESLGPTPDSAESAVSPLPADLDARIAKLGAGRDEEGSDGPGAEQEHLGLRGGYLMIDEREKRRRREKKERSDEKERRDKEGRVKKGMKDRDMKERKGYESDDGVKLLQPHEPELVEQKQKAREATIAEEEDDDKEGDEEGGEVARLSKSQMKKIARRERKAREAAEAAAAAAAASEGSITKATLANRGVIDGGIALPTASRDVKEEERNGKQRKKAKTMAEQKVKPTDAVHPPPLHELQQGRKQVSS